MLNFALGFGAACALAILFPTAFKAVLTWIEDMWARFFPRMKD